MKQFLTTSIIFLAHTVFGQGYDEQMNKAGEYLQKKDYCNALTVFKNAFSSNARPGLYDYAYAGLAAANCNDTGLAMQWLEQSRAEGLGMNPGEIDFISNDSGFINLHNHPQWDEFINAMRKSFSDKQLAETNRSNEWVNSITANAIKPGDGKKFNQCNAGFALYTINVNGMQVPYMVYIPESYDAGKPMQAIVYLHGGIVSTEEFAYKNPGLATGEPVFSMGNMYDAIIIYPFGKKDFGWVDQKEAFKNVITEIKNLQGIYNINAKRIFLGGMSNGGTAAFWYASQKENMFRGFYAFSAMPELKIEGMNFKHIVNGKPFYMINAKDDDIFKFEDVNKLYESHKTAAGKWYFEALENGGHGFIYQQNGKEIMAALFKKLLAD